MRIQRTHNRRAAAFAAALILLAGACTDLDVVNPNEPDRTRVLSRPDDVESVIASGFRLWFPNTQDGYPNMALAASADRLTGGFLDFYVTDLSWIPRLAWDNSPLNTRASVAEDPWYEMYRALSSVNDGLFALNNGIQLEPGGDGPRTRRARAFGKFIQGLAHGYLALTFDKALIVTENTDLEQLDTRDFRPYTEVRDTAIALLDEAIRIANQGAFTIPGTIEWINGIPLTNAQLIQLANNYAARFIAYTPRTVQERDAVDWNRVIARVDAGYRQDFAPLGQLEVIESNTRRLLARVRTNPSDHIRPSYWALGPADQSRRFQAWVAAEPATRMPFEIRTPDKRIHATPTTTAAGKYFGFGRQSIWSSSRGTYRWSWYTYIRHGLGETWYTGPQPTMLKAEMDLLKAEGLIRLGRAAEAVPLINATRTANGELPPVTVAGPPDDANCVPRKLSGACGSLWDALRYEKNIEMLGIEGQQAWWDARGWGTLQQGSPLQLPIPGRELENLGLPLYTFGGSNLSSAPAPNRERCPVALARC